MGWWGDVLRWVGLDWVRLLSGRLQERMRDNRVLVIEYEYGFEYELLVIELRGL